MSIRTDIAIERHDFLKETHKKGVKVQKWKKENVEIVRVEIENLQGEKMMEKPMGKYYTVDLPEFSHESELLDIRLRILTDIIKELLPENAETFLVAGLGNDNITPDALGPLCARKIFSTRHFENFTELKQNLPNLNPVASISTGVLGQTGIEAGDIAKALVEKTEEIGCGTVASVCGRYYAMDRDNRWDRIEQAYNAITMGEGKHFKTAQRAR